jgi:hypothetical protein
VIRCSIILLERKSKTNATSICRACDAFIIHVTAQHNNPNALLFHLNCGAFNRSRCLATLTQSLLTRPATGSVSTFATLHHGTARRTLALAERRGA